MFELYLYQVGGIDIAWHVGEPVVGIQLSVLPAYSLVAQASVAAHHDVMFVTFLHILFLLGLSMIPYGYLLFLQ
jgi:hypothetical protein